MSKTTYFSRYTGIIKILLRCPSTFEEIQDFLSRDSEWLGEGYEFSKRTFQRDVNEIRTIFDMDIQYDFSRKVYFIADGEKENISTRLLEAMDIFNALKMSEKYNQYIIFEKRRPQGTENFSILLDGIQKKKIMRFTYTKFWNEETSTREVEPYSLKESRGRWYLIAKDCKDNIIKSFGLDRLHEPEVSKTKFDFPKELIVENLFKHSFGIINDIDTKPQMITLSFSPEQGKYIKTYPLHDSQEIIKDNEEELRIKLYLRITHDLEMELLSYGEDIKIISPKSLINRITKKLENALSIYKG